jgi:hypothetical protein
VREGLTIIIIIVFLRIPNTSQRGVLGVLKRIQTKWTYSVWTFEEVVGVEGAEPHLGRVRVVLLELRARVQLDEVTKLHPSPIARGVIAVY